MAALTAEETELYDRQIRAWGFEAQKRMRESKILVIGLDGAGSENLKNLVLAGLGNITILENKIVDNLLIETHFYLQPNHLNLYFADVALNYFGSMNPNIKLSKCTDDAYCKTDDFYKSFDVVIINNYSRYFQLRINEICNKHNIGFFSCRSIGSFGYIFADLQEHKYQIIGKNVENNNDNNRENEGKENKKIESLKWYSLESALSSSNKLIEKEMKQKAKKYKSFFYSLQICEQIEDKILEINKYFIHNKDNIHKSRDLQIIEAIKSIQNEKSLYNKVFIEIQSKIKKSGQFKENDMKNNKLLNDLLTVWNLSVCPSNAILGGYLANFVMFYVQRKQKPLHNFLFFDMWTCEALEVLMRNENDEKNEKKYEKHKNNQMDIDEIDDIDDKSPNKSNKETVDISKLSVDKNKKQNKKSNEIVLLDDSDDDDEDIDLTK